MKIDSSNLRSWEGHLANTEKLSTLIGWLKLRACSLMLSNILLFFFLVGINTLVNVMAKFACMEETDSHVVHNERLEFLGDAVVEFLTSIHLFHLFPWLEEGGLATYRCASLGSNISFLCIEIKKKNRKSKKLE